MFSADDAAAKERRRQRKQRHNKRKSPGKRKGKSKDKGKGQKPCKQEPVAQTCAGKCILHGKTVLGAGAVPFTPPTLRRLHITCGFHTVRAGGIGVNGSRTMEDCTVAGNHGRIGAGVAGYSGGLVMTRCTVRNNHPPAGSSLLSSGGRLFISFSAMLTDCVVTDNSSDEGGGISLARAAASWHRARTACSYRRLRTPLRS